MGALALLALLSLAHAGPVSVASPDGALVARVSDEQGIIRYSITLDGREVLGPSLIGIRSDGVSHGKLGTLGEARRHEVNESYPFFGAKSTAVNRARIVTVPVRADGNSCLLDLHVADDGVGIRLRLPAKAGRRVEADESSWSIAGDPTAWAMPYEPAYEEHYATSPLKGLAGQELGLPLTAKLDHCYATISEAALKDYGDLSVRVAEDGRLEGRLPHDPQGWATDREVIQPWRVTIVARDLTALVNSTLIQNLNPPADPSVKGADWIQPGRSSWQWMAIGAPEFDDQEQWVDWTRELGYEYYLVDDGWKNWPDAWKSFESVCDYAASRGVKVWVWVHSNEVREPEARRAYFKRVADAGAVGVKIDFPAPTNHGWSTWYHDTTRDAAEHKLLVNYHGGTKPTGMERTWPNELTRESVRGHEWHMTRYRRRLEAAHDTILPFTRYVIGHGDYTPMVFERSELQGNSWAHEIAQAVVFTSPFLCMGGHPKNYVANPAKDVISALPATWDETRVLPGSEPGRVAAMARRSGGEWFVGVLNGADTRKMELVLDFLGQGKWKATCLGDVDGAPDSWAREEKVVDARGSLELNLSSRGGFVAWIRK